MYVPWEKSGALDDECNKDILDSLGISFIVLKILYSNPFEYSNEPPLKFTKLYFQQSNINAIISQGRALIWSIWKRSIGAQFSIKCRVRNVQQNWIQTMTPVMVLVYFGIPVLLAMGSPYKDHYSLFNEWNKIKESECFDALKTNPLQTLTHHFHLSLIF